jgi:hypothetical protein
MQILYNKLNNTHKLCPASTNLTKKLKHKLMKWRTELNKTLTLRELCLNSKCHTAIDKHRSSSENWTDGSLFLILTCSACGSVLWAHRWQHYQPEHNASSPHALNEAHWQRRQLQKQHADWTLVLKASWWKGREEGGDISPPFPMSSLPSALRKRPTAPCRSQPHTKKLIKCWGFLVFHYALNGRTEVFEMAKIRILSYGPWHCVVW